MLHYATGYDGREDRICKSFHPRTEPRYGTARSQSGGNGHVRCAPGRPSTGSGEQHYPICAQMPYQLAIDVA